MAARGGGSLQSAIPLLLPSISPGRIKLNPNLIHAGMLLLAIRTGWIGERSRRRGGMGRVRQPQIGADENPRFEPARQHELAARRISRLVGELRLSQRRRSCEGEAKCCRSGDEAASAAELAKNVNHSSPPYLPPYYFFGGNGIGPSKYPGGSLGRMNWVWPLMIGLCWVSEQAAWPTKVSVGMSP